MATPEEHYEYAVSGFGNDDFEVAVCNALMVIATDVIQRRAAEASAVKIDSYAGKYDALDSRFRSHIKRIETRDLF
jgi:hypothetical protein